MESIAELSEEAARGLRGVCFDVDDTVTTHGLLDPEAYTAMWALRAAGLKLLAVTGRPLGFAEIIARTWPVDAAVGENGAGYVARVDGELRFGYWDPAEQRASQQKTLAALRERVARELPTLRLSSDGWARRCDLAFDIGEQRQVELPDVERLLALIEAEGAHASVSSIHAHAQLGTHDKAKGVALAAEALWQIDADQLREHFLFVGDSGNDAAAFAFFRHSAGVANVSRHLARLPVPPRYVASASYGRGFAEIAALVLGRRGTRG